MKTWNELPKEIREKMLERADMPLEQAVISFNNCITGGFVWDESPEGHEFWERILLDEEYDHFYYRYPFHRSVEGRLEMLKAEVRELRKERDVTSCGCKGVEIRIPKRKCSNIVTEFPGRVGSEIKINNKWVGNLYADEEQGDDLRGFMFSGHRASLFLSSLEGQWYDQRGNKVSGYFYYKPNDED